MHELVSKVEGGCMSTCFHMASTAEYRMAAGLGQAKVQISEEFDWFLGAKVAGFKGGV